MQTVRKALSVIVCALMAAIGCTQPTPETVEVVKTVEVTVPVEVTQVIERTVRETVEVTRVVEKIVTPTAKPPTPTPEKTLEGIKNDLTEVLIEGLEGTDDVNRVNLVRWGDGMLEIELQTAWAARDNQPDVSWKTVSLISKALVIALESDSRKILTGSKEPSFLLTTYSSDGDYRYVSETAFETLEHVRARSISYAEWQQEANAGFR